MLRAIQVGGLLLVLGGAGWAIDQKNTGGGRAPASRPAPAHNGGAGGNPRLPKQPIGPPLTNPASPAARLYRATPEQRDRALEKLPPRLQQQLRAQLDRFDAMPKPQQEIMIRRAERYAALSPEQRELVRRQMVSLRSLPQERRAAVGLALRRLQPMSEEQRLETVNSDEFKSRFSTEEQKIIAGLSEVMIPPL
jgi:phage-related protein